MQYICLNIILFRGKKSNDNRHKIKLLREQKNISQEQFSEMIGVSSKLSIIMKMILPTQIVLILKRYAML